MVEKKTTHQTPRTSFTENRFPLCVHTAARVHLIRAENKPFVFNCDHEMELRGLTSSHVSWPESGEEAGALSASQNTLRLDRWKMNRGADIIHALMCSPEIK